VLINPLDWFLTFNRFSFWWTDS